jgi:predicted transcriptional regulator
MAHLEAIKYVRDLMTVGVLTCSADTPILEIARRLLDQALDDMVVLEEGHAIGVISPAELIQALTHPDFDDLRARDVMRDGVAQTPPEIPLEAAAQIMLDLGVRSLFVMHHAGGIEYPAAVLSYRHLLRYMTASSSDDLKDLGISAQRQMPLESFIKRRDEARSRHLGKK